MAQRPFLGLDLDGTILDCRPRQEAVLLSIVPEAAPVANRLWQLKRSGHSTREALKSLNITPPKDFTDRWMDLIESETFLKVDALLPDADAALAALGEALNLHLITSRQRPEGVCATLKRLNLQRHFAQITVVPAGPGASTAKAEAIKQFDTFAHCGDTEVDGRAAETAGVPFLAVTCGQRSAEFLSHSAAPHEIGASLKDLVEPIFALRRKAEGP
ncbi:HAD family hydrolase [Roseovarius aestuariivivens]|uniref:HAD family hydrolase n=1 Tax=Roseovarius aestuariivivens TaxID=1888910 RepID=UPI001081E2CF|nr:HAD hydrolase-like protein [Roseovarius aestuariivivens]